MAALVPATTWTKLKNITLHQSHQTETRTQPVIAFTLKARNRCVYRHRKQLSGCWGLRVGTDHPQAHVALCGEMAAFCSWTAVKGAQLHKS